MNQKKGQFLVFSAVAILLILFGLFSGLNTEWKSDISGVQADDSNAVLESIQNGINATVVASRQTPGKLEENLRRFELAERNALKEQYSVSIIFYVGALTVSSNITLGSPETFVEKTFVVER